jgi:hypothetical protein
MVADEGDCWMGVLEADASSSRNNERDCLPMPGDNKKFDK